MRDIYSSIYNLGLRLADVMGIAAVTAAVTVPNQRYVVVFYDPDTKLLDWCFFTNSASHPHAFESLLCPGVVHICTDHQMTAVELADKLEAEVASLEG